MASVPSRLKMKIGGMIIERSTARSDAPEHQSRFSLWSKVAKIIPNESLHFTDPTAYLPCVILEGRGPIGTSFRERQIPTYRAAADVVWRLPYRRHSAEPEKYRRVLSDEGGTCSSKHALLAALAREEGIPVSLVLGFYELNGSNRPCAAKTLHRYGLHAVPESHCWLEYENYSIDITEPPTGTNRDPVQRTFFWRQIIQPEDVDFTRRKIHRAVIADWLTKQGLPFSVDEILRILAQCKAA